MTKVTSEPHVVAAPRVILLDEVRYYYAVLTHAEGGEDLVSRVNEYHVDWWR